LSLGIVLAAFLIRHGPAGYTDHGVVSSFAGSPPDLEPERAALISPRTRRTQRSCVEPDWARLVRASGV